MPLPDVVRLRHMLEAAEQAQAFCANTTPESFAEDPRTHRAVHNCLQVIGEAAVHVSDSTRSAIPTVPWRPIVRMRNILVHVYFDINTVLVWRVVQDDLPPLMDAIRAYLQSHDTDDEADAGV